MQISIQSGKSLLCYEQASDCKVRHDFGKRNCSKYWKIGCRSLGADSKQYILILHGKLTLIMSSHVDDLKGGVTAETQELVLGELRKMVDGELKRETAQTDQCRRICDV